MKELAFAELLDFVAEARSYDMVDDLIDDCQLTGGGAHTSDGTYDRTETKALRVTLARRTGADAPNILKRFGRHPCRRLVANLPDLFRRLDDWSCRPPVALGGPLIPGASDHFRASVGVIHKLHEAPGGGFVRYPIRHLR